MNRLKVIGITGGVGSGKTTVASMYANMNNAYVIYTDNVAKELQKKGNTCYNLIVEHFGESILDEYKEIDRAKLADIVFKDEEELKKLNSFVHKEVINQVNGIIERISLDDSYKVILLESAILFQVEELKDLCNEIWYVDSKDKDRRERLKRERNYSDERIDSMMHSQECIHLIKEKCDKVVINDRDIAKLKELLAKM